MIVMTLDMMTSKHNRDGIIRTFRQFIGPIEAQQGCRGCRLLQDIRSENRLLYIEMWEEENDVMRRIRSASFKKFLAIMELSREKPEFCLQTILNTRGLEAIKLIRQTALDSIPKSEGLLHG